MLSKIQRKLYELNDISKVHVFFVPNLKVSAFFRHFSPFVFVVLFF